MRHALERHLRGCGEGEEAVSSENKSMRGMVEGSIGSRDR